MYRYTDMLNNALRSWNFGVIDIVDRNFLIYLEMRYYTWILYSEKGRRELK